MTSSPHVVIVTGSTQRVVELAAPLKRIGQLGDVAEVVLALARSSYVTGQVVAIDGGLTLAV
jgi:NAD(P)-dependent dehydrogenase (short-subunit alcohol dehydrogenase family)